MVCFLIEWHKNVGSTIELSSECIHVTVALRGGGIIFLNVVILTIIPN